MANMYQCENLDGANVHEGKLVAITINPHTAGTKISNNLFACASPVNSDVYNNSHDDCHMQNSIINQTTYTSKKQTTKENAGELNLGQGWAKTKSLQPVCIAENSKLVSSINTESNRTVIASK
jgi:hypothetical protein